MLEFEFKKIQLSTTSINLSFKTYLGLEHNFFKVKKDGTIDYEDYRYDQVAGDFFDWLNKQSD